VRDFKTILEIALKVLNPAGKLLTETKFVSFFSATFLVFIYHYMYIGRNGGIIF